MKNFNIKTRIIKSLVEEEIPQEILYLIICNNLSTVFDKKTLGIRQHDQDCVYGDESSDIL